MDVDGFELEIFSWIQSISKPRQSIKPWHTLQNDMTWTALLFAVLAAGLQSSGDRTPSVKIICRRYCTVLCLVL